MDSPTGRLRNGPWCISCGRYSTAIKCHACTINEQQGVVSGSGFPIDQDTEFFHGSTDNPRAKWTPVSLSPMKVIPKARQLGPSFPPTMRTARNFVIQLDSLVGYNYTGYLEKWVLGISSLSKKFTVTDPRIPWYRTSILERTMYQ